MCAEKAQAALFFTAPGVRSNAVQLSAANAHEPTIKRESSHPGRVAHFWQFGCAVWDSPREPTCADRVTVQRVERLLHVRGTVAPLDVQSALRRPHSSPFDVRSPVPGSGDGRDSRFADRSIVLRMLSSAAPREPSALCCAALVVILASASAAQAQTTVTATWDRNTDATTAGYRLYYGTAPGNYQWSLDAGNQVSAPLALTPGTRYLRDGAGATARTTSTVRRRPKSRSTSRAPPPPSPPSCRQTTTPW